MIQKLIRLIKKFQIILLFNKEIIFKFLYQIIKNFKYDFIINHMFRDMKNVIKL